MDQDDGWEPTPHHTQFHLRHYESPPPPVSPLGLRVGSNGGAGRSLLWLVLSAKSAALAHKQF